MNFPLIAMLGCMLLSIQGAELPPITKFQDLAAKQGGALVIPLCPKTRDEVTRMVQEKLKRTDEGLNTIAKISPDSRNFKNTFLKIDELRRYLQEMEWTLDTVSKSSTDKGVRDGASMAVVKLKQAGLAISYREDLYNVLKDAAARHKPRNTEEERHIFLTLREFKRAGMHLGPEERKEVEKLRKELAGLQTLFSDHITEAVGEIGFTADDLEGVSDTFKQGLKQAEGKFIVMANITTHFLTVIQNAKREETRKAIMTRRYNLAREKNLPVLKQMVLLRAEIASRLGYNTWADYQVEPRMAKDARTVADFLEDLVKLLEPKFQDETATLTELKRKETGDPSAVLKVWDVEYYRSQLLKERYSVDLEALRVFFPYQQTVDRMMQVFGKVLDLKFTEVEPENTWFSDVQLYVVQDAKSDKVLGAFYLDMFPRADKYNHFACFPFKTGAPLPNGSYELPVNVLLCNFPSATSDTPSLLKHSDVIVLFHEFGHVVHGVLTRSEFFTQTGFNVPLDFVEAPSQMLENWVWDKDILNFLAGDYRDATKKIPHEVLDQLIKSRIATEALMTRRQLALALSDQNLHNASPDEAHGMEVASVGNQTWKRVYFEPPSGTAYLAYFGHLAEYDAGYYGYAWAQSLSIDMATAFRKSPKGFWDKSVGWRLRKEVYEPGYTREVRESVEKFLGRPASSRAFMEYLGIRN